MIETLLLAVTSFIGTNIDDLFIDTMLFAKGTGKIHTRNIYIGKYLGIGTLILLSVLGASGLRLLPHGYIGYLGVIPILLGIKEIISALKPETSTEELPERSSNTVLNTALITIANGADNLSIYIPLFTGFAIWQTLLTLCVFLVMVALWCWFGSTLSRLPLLKDILARYKKIIIPGVYIALGVYILITNFA